MAKDRSGLRIGEVARRTGLSVSTLRAWERRYELLDPERTEGGHRLYGDRDVERVRAVQSLIDQGWSASAAAQEVKESGQRTATVTELRPLQGGGDRTAAEELTERLKAGFDAFDTPEIESILDDTFARLDPAAALEAVILPAIRWVGEGWQSDPRVIAREHLASRLVAARLTRVLRSSGVGGGKSLVAAGPELDEHELGVLAASAVAASNGWRVHYLGARTPRGALEKAAAELKPDVILIGGVYRDHGLPLVQSPPDVGGRPIVFGGPAFREEDGQKGRRIMVHTGSLKQLPETLELARQASRAL